MDKEQAVQLKRREYIVEGKRGKSEIELKPMRKVEKRRKNESDGE